MVYILDVGYKRRVSACSTVCQIDKMSNLAGKQVVQETDRILHTTINTACFISKDCEREIKPTFSRYIDYIYAEGKIVALHVHNTTANADSLYYVQTDLLGSWDRIVDGSSICMAME